MRRVAWALCAVCVVLGACSSDDRPPLVSAGPSGEYGAYGGGGAAAARDGGGEPARKSDGGSDASSDAAADAGPSCSCDCHGTVRYGAVFIKLELPCGASLCAAGELHTCSTSCRLTTSRC